MEFYQAIKKLSAAEIAALEVLEKAGWRFASEMMVDNGFIPEANNGRRMTWARNGRHDLVAVLPDVSRREAPGASVFADVRPAKQSGNGAQKRRGRPKSK